MIYKYHEPTHQNKKRVGREGRRGIPHEAGREALGVVPLQTLPLLVEKRSKRVGRLHANTTPTGTKVLAGILSAHAKIAIKTEP